MIPVSTLEAISQDSPCYGQSLLHVAPTTKDDFTGFYSGRSVAVPLSLQNENFTTENQLHRILAVCFRICGGRRTKYVARGGTPDDSGNIDQDAVESLPGHV